MTITQHHTRLAPGIAGLARATSNAVQLLLRLFGLLLLSLATLWSGAALAVTTTTSLSASPSAVAVGQTVTLTASVNSSSATGAVTFMDGVTSLGTVNLSNGVALFSKTFASAGVYNLSAVYTPNSGNYSGSTSPISAEAVGSPPAYTTTTLSASPIYAGTGQAVTLTAVVSPSGATGTVTFSDNGYAVGAVAVNNGAAVLSKAFATAGTHYLTAVFNPAGSGIYFTSTSATVSEMVANGVTGTATSLNVSATTLTIGQTATLTATVWPSTATGSVTFVDGGTSLATVSLSNGVAVLNKAFTTVGAHGLAVNYVPNSSTFVSSFAGPVTTTVAYPLVSTTTTLSANPSTANIGQTVTLAASVSPSNATGTITFMDGSSALGAVSLSNGQALLPKAFSTAGAHSLIAVYNPGAGYASGTSAVVTETIINPSAVATTTTLSVSPTTQNQGLSTTLVASVYPSSATGSVTFLDGGAVFATVNLYNGAASFTNVFSTVGTHSLVAVYNPGTTGYATSTSPTVVHTVNSPAPTYISLSSSAPVTYLGQGVQLTASLSPNPLSNPYVSPGTITFKDGNTTLGSVTAGALGGTLSVSFSTPGSHSLTAVYSGTAGLAPSTSTAISQTVVIPTALNLSVSPSLVYAGQTITLSASVLASPVAGTITGTVTFMDSGTRLGTSTVSGGIATLPFTFGTLGSHSLMATYTGDATYTSGYGSGSVTVQARPTTTALASSSTTVSVGQSLTLTATVSAGTVTGTITGTVTFKDGSTTLGTSTLNAGVASLGTSFATAGTHSLTAVFSGNGIYATSTSASLSETVTAGTTTLTLSASPTSGVVGQSATLTASISPSSASGTVTFKDGATTLGTASLSGGVAIFGPSFSSAGLHSLSASYAGNGGFQASMANLAYTVNGAPGALPPAPVSAAPMLGYGYDAQGNRTAVTLAPDSLALTIGTAYDPLSRPKTVTDPANASVQLGYDGGNRLTTVTDARSLTTQYQRDGLGQATQQASPDTGSASQTYDAAGRLLTRTDSRGVLASHSYDALDRLTATVFSKAGQANQAYSWAYDQTGGSFTNGIGRLTSTAFPDGSASYAYDAQGRVTQVRQLVNANASANPQAIVQYTGYGYDAGGRLTSLTYPSGRVLSISYANGLPTALGLARNAVSAASPLVGNLQFAPFGAAQSWNWAMASGPVLHSRSFDTSGRLTRYPLGEHLRDVAYDAAGRITGYTHYLAASGASTGSAAPAQDQQFAYDAAGRLTQATTAQASWAYAYDASGNRTSVTVNGGTPNAYTIAADSNRLSQIATPAITLSYDATGDITSDGNFTLAYDLRGRTASLSQGGFVATYSHDNAGQRIRKYSNTGTASTVVFAYDLNGQLLGEYDSQGNALREYVWLGDLPLAVFTPDASQGANAATAAPLVYYIHADHLNTPRAVVDSSNTLRWRWLSEPFGTTAPETSPAGQAAFTFNLRFPGQYLDAESGIFYALGRDYVPGIGRYAQAGPAAWLAPANPYGFANANPVGQRASPGQPKAAQASGALVP